MVHQTHQWPITPAKWGPRTPLIGNVEPDSTALITTVRLWSVLRRFFLKIAEIIEGDSPATADKLRRASPRWMRHTHATHARDARPGARAELTTVRDNLRHASIQTTSIYLHNDEVKRARQMDAAFAARGSGSSTSGSCGLS
jgi:site-specific recombinase XerD